MTVPSFFSPAHNRTVKLGRNISGRLTKPLKSRLHFAAYIDDKTVDQIVLPDSLDWSQLPAGDPNQAALTAALADVDGNDTLGDCVIACLAHFRAISSAQSGKTPVHFTLAQIIAMYGTWGGYVPGDSSTDNGCDEGQVIQDLISTGWPDGVKVTSALLVDGTDPREKQLAIYLFLALITGAGLPQAWISPFPTGPGYVWDKAGPPVPTNGHCTLQYGWKKSANGALYLTDSWGLPGFTTEAADGTYMVPAAQGELHAILTPEIINSAKGLAANGIAWQDLESDIAALNQGDGAQVPAST